MDEIDLERVGGFQRFVALAQRALDVDRVGDVEERHERGAVGQRHRDQVGDAAVAQFKPALDAVAALDRRDRGAQPLPERLVVVERTAPLDHRLDMRSLGKRLGRQPPHRAERRIVQPQAAVAAEHRDRFGEIVERFALHADQRVKAPGQLAASR